MLQIAKTRSGGTFFPSYPDNLTLSWPHFSAHTSRLNGTAYRQLLRINSREVSSIHPHPTILLFFFLLLSPQCRGKYHSAPFWSNRWGFSALKADVSWTRIMLVILKHPISIEGEACSLIPINPNPSYSADTDCKAGDPRQGTRYLRPAYDMESKPWRFSHHNTLVFWRP